MKLSEAILLGSTMKPQAFGPFFYPERSCALQAALDAQHVMLSQLGNTYDKAIEIWPWLKTEIQSPLTQEGHQTVVYHIIGAHLNDMLHWTRPQIAAWVAELEKVYDPTPITTEVHNEAVRSDLVGQY